MTPAAAAMASKLPEPDSLSRRFKKSVIGSICVMHRSRTVIGSIISYRNRYVKHNNADMTKANPLPPEKRSNVLATQYAKIAGGRAFGVMREAMAEAGLAIGTGTLQRLAEGDMGVRVDSIQKLAHFGGMTVEELIGRSLEPEGPFVEVRRADVKFSNGHGTVVYGVDDMPPLSFRADFLRKIGIAKGNAVVVDADGYSNEPAIVDGSVVLVDTGDRDRLAGDFFAFRVDGELLIKRLERLEGVGIVATAENSNFKPKMKVYREGVDDFEVIGRARWVGTML